MNEDDFSDPSDWNNTSLSAISPLDSSLRCLICKDFYTAPVITTCLHTFCSLCIRRSLSTEAICPACRTTNISDSGLRQNKVVADLVENFLVVRPRLLEIAHGQSLTNHMSNAPPPLPQEANGVRTEDDTPITTESLLRDPPPAPGIHCPICQHPFKSVEQVDRHIDTCTGVPSAPSTAASTVSSQSYNLRPQRLIQSSSLPQNNVQLVKPLPKLNYAMHNDKQLRAKLSEHGLSTYGSKPVLIARHKEYVNVHNANIDRLHPQSRQEILKHMERWDATQQTLFRPEKRKELDGEEWRRRCKSDFEDLARQAKESVKRRKMAEQTVNGEGTSVAVAPAQSSQEETIA